MKGQDSFKGMPAWKGKGKGDYKGKGGKPPQQNQQQQANVAQQATSSSPPVVTERQETAHAEESWCYDDSYWTNDWSDWDTSYYGYDEYDWYSWPSYYVLVEEQAITEDRHDTHFEDGQNDSRQYCFSVECASNRTQIQSIRPAETFVASDSNFTHPTVLQSDNRNECAFLKLWSRCTASPPLWVRRLRLQSDICHPWLRLHSCHGIPLCNRRLVQAVPREQGEDGNVLNSILDAIGNIPILPCFRSRWFRIRWVPFCTVQLAWVIPATALR